MTDNPAQRARTRAGMSQPAFAAAYRIPLGTLRLWEQGRREPGEASRTLLLAIEREPETVRRILA